ncbi:endochitinase A-like [Portunus trituberculatus]|uniref:endochitinase A-like n=1 Tax=Portunus trituberculatus TaxID=210409 RepID=UPI001E1CBDD6|nr:endochitinase A-like [Portunus trituberculatus]
MPPSRGLPLTVAGPNPPSTAPGESLAYSPCSSGGPGLLYSRWTKPRHTVQVRSGSATAVPESTTGADVMRTTTSTTSTATTTSTASSLKATTSTTRPVSRHATSARRHTASHLRIQKTSRLSENIQDNHTFKSCTPHPSPSPPGSSRPAWKSFLRVLSQHSSSLYWCKTSYIYILLFIFRNLHVNFTTSA